MWAFFKLSGRKSFNIYELFESNIKARLMIIYTINALLVNVVDIKEREMKNIICLIWLCKLSIGIVNRCQKSLIKRWNAMHEQQALIMSISSSHLSNIDICNSRQYNFSYIYNHYLMVVCDILICSLISNSSNKLILQIEKIHLFFSFFVLLNHQIKCQ